ncbi:hypothetical protein GCM10020369_31180 [Cryptosporangium minutisporangium]|uniref:Arginine decarboxylase n=1 Tax=Cryptosporangium minutisporangium TaxID=113569 RepID=A0ABP6SY61_9ACTN
MLSIAGPGEKLLVSRNAHKSVVAGLIPAGMLLPDASDPSFQTVRVVA